MDDYIAARRAIEINQKLIDKALRIVDKAPYWSGTFDGWAKLFIHRERSTLSWPEIEDNYGVHTIEPCQISFPTELLFTTDDELAKWKEDETRLYREQEEARKENESKERTLKEKELYESLKAKYG